MSVPDAIDTLRDALKRLNRPNDAHDLLGGYAEKVGYARSSIETALQCLGADEIERHDAEDICPECTEHESDCVCDSDAAPKGVPSYEREAWMAGVPAAGPL